jgi:hypothetical protein
VTQPTDRPGIDHITSDGLDTLYAERDAAQAELAENTGVLQALRRHRDQAEATLTAVRELHAPVQYRQQTICGHCSGYGGGSCDNGTHLYPCDTVAVLDQHGQTTV